MDYISRDLILELLYSSMKWDLIEIFYGNSAEHFAAVKKLYSDCVIDPIIEIFALNAFSYRSFFKIKFLFIYFVIFANLNPVDLSNLVFFTKEMYEISLPCYNFLAQWTFLYSLMRNYTFFEYIIMHKKSKLEEIFLNRLADYIYESICLGNVNVEFIEFINKIVI